MKNKIKDLFKISTKEKADPKILRKDIKKILESFKKENIDFCILRNYVSLEKNKDIDLLVNDRKGIHKIMERFGFRKRSSYGPYTSYKRKDLWFDFKVGCIAYQGFCFEKASSILQRKRLYKYYYVPKEEDEFIHLILHPVLYKGYFKIKYKRRINSLLKKISKKDVIDKLERKFPNYGTKLFYLIKNKKYNESLKLKKQLLSKLFNIRDFPFFCIMKMIEFYGRQLNKNYKKTIK